MGVMRTRCKIGSYWRGIVFEDGMVEGRSAVEKDSVGKIGGGKGLTTTVMFQCTYLKK